MFKNAEYRLSLSQSLGRTDRIMPGGMGGSNGKKEDARVVREGRGGATSRGRSRCATVAEAAQISQMMPTKIQTKRETMTCSSAPGRWSKHRFHCHGSQAYDAYLTKVASSNQQNNCIYQLGQRREGYWQPLCIAVSRGTGVMCSSKCLPFNQIGEKKHLYTCVMTLIIE